jgi:hypothetical protein
MTRRKIKKELKSLCENLRRHAVAALGARPALIGERRNLLRIQGRRS